MRTHTSAKSALAITVFYGGNSLMHQVSNWVGKHPTYDFELSFAESLPELRTVMRRASVAVVDATEDPARAMAVFREVTAELGADRVAVYTERMHEGLELFVRARGVLLLLGPMSDAPWEELFEGMLRSVGQMPLFGLPPRRRAEGDAGRATA
jgi:hypothetical protein